MHTRHWIYTILFLSSIFPILFVPSLFAVSTKSTQFITTAYYSPLPDQTYYLFWNLEDEKRVQGQGVAGASGEGVHVGMLAAPKSYSFGTKIHIEWLGVWIVEDRGWAIVSWDESWEWYDRIDIWMGYGEEWLKRALAWGKKTVTWTIVDDTTPSSLDISNIDIDSIRFPDKTYTLESIGIKRSPDTKWETVILASQEKIESSHEILSQLAHLGYDTGMTFSGVIFEYQKDHGIIMTVTDTGAWVYGPRTRASLREEYTKYLSEKEKQKEWREREQRLLLEEHSNWSERYSEALKKVESFWDPKMNDTWVHIRELQILLRDLGFFHEKDTAIFWPKTEQALREYQKSRFLTPSGSLDTATIESLVEVIAWKSTSEST